MMSRGVAGDSRHSSVSNCAELVGLTAGFFATAGFLWCLLDPCWKVTSQDLSVQPYDVCYGIWKGCTLPSDGSWICDGFHGKTVIDLNIGAIALLVGGLGSQCCIVQSLMEEQKAKFCRFAGGLFITGGALVASAGSWYFTEIYYERVWYYRTAPPGLGYTVGRAIFIALASGLLGIVAGLCFMCFSKHGCCFDEEIDEYKQPQYGDRKVHTSKRKQYAVTPVTEYV